MAQGKRIHKLHSFSHAFSSPAFSFQSKNSGFRMDFGAHSAVRPHDGNQIPLCELVDRGVIFKKKSLARVVAREHSTERPQNP
jgi:hypothetical protein